jgi:hypothetical protein
MPVRKRQDPKKLSRAEVLGAWLGVWTPPRDARIPPVPRAKVAAGAALLAVVAALVAVFAVPAIDETKQERAAAEAEEQGERRAARRARQRAEQQPRRGRLMTDGTRAEALLQAEAAIGRDAQRRFNPNARPATCEVMPGSDEAAERVAYACLSAYRAIEGAGMQEGARGALGIPYRAILDFGASTFVFCKVNPIPGEQIVPDPRQIVELPAACRTPRAHQRTERP